MSTLTPQPARAEQPAAEPQPPAAASTALPAGRVAGDGDYRGGWLCPTKADRTRLTDMNSAVRRTRRLAALFLGLGVVLSVPWLGATPLIAFAIGAGPLLLLDRPLAKTSRPEWWVAGSLSTNTALILTTVALTHGVDSPFLPWVAIPVVTAAARFRLPVFIYGSVLTTAALLLAVAVGSPHALAHNPTPVIATIVLLATLVVAQQPLLDAELRWRRDAVLDPLTGLLNRQGLQSRFREVAEQARLTDAPVSLVMCDLDAFKTLNDQHGHAVGDAVLKDVAYTLRKELRTFELLYRIGGEELLLVLPGASPEAGLQVAEQVRAAIERSRPAGLNVTTSVGVSTAVREGIDFSPMFEAADAALYAAKRAGRNCVRVAGAPSVA